MRKNIKILGKFPHNKEQMTVPLQILTNLTLKKKAVPEIRQN